MKKLTWMTLAVSALALTACSDDDDTPGAIPENPEVEDLFIVCNGNFGAGNGSLSVYDPEDRTVENDVFYRVNDQRLGDTPQSMTWHGDKGWIVVNGSGVVFAIDSDYHECGRIEGLVSPRNIYFVNDSKAYITEMYTNRITVINPKTYSITGYIEIPGMDASTGSTEEIIGIGNYVYVNCWSYQKEVVKIDPTTDKVVGSVETGIQPCSIAYDPATGLLWTLNDGGSWEGNPIGYVAPSIVAIDPVTMKIERSIELTLGSSVSSLTYHNGALYWLDNGVWKLNVRENIGTPVRFISSTSWGLYGLTVNPDNGDIYVADAIDYMQAGIVYRYDNAGLQTDVFTVGVIPGGFCWELDD